MDSCTDFYISVCRSIDCKSYLWQQITRLLFHTSILQTYFEQGSKVCSWRFYLSVVFYSISISRYGDIEAEDPSFYKSLEFLLSNPVEHLGTEFNFTLEVDTYIMYSTVNQVVPYIHIFIFASAILKMLKWWHFAIGLV